MIMIKKMLVTIFILCAINSYVLAADDTLPNWKISLLSRATDSVCVNSYKRGIDLSLTQRNDLWGDVSERQAANTGVIYRVEITPYFGAQSTVQLIANPGMDLSIKNASVAGERMDVESLKWPESLHI